MARTKALSVRWCRVPFLPGFKTSRLITRTFGGMFIPALFCATATVAAVAAAKHRQAPNNMVTTIFILCRPPRRRHVSRLLAWKGRTEIPARKRDKLAGIGGSVLGLRSDVKLEKPQRTVQFSFTTLT